MNTYVALFRGINVSGQKKIKMADLREHMTVLEFEDVKTYIQSGNLVFKSPETSIEKLEQRIADKIQQAYGFEVSILIRTPEEIRTPLIENPFAQNPENDPKRFYVAFLDAEPDEEKLTALQEMDLGEEEFEVIGKTLYFFVPQGYSNSKMNNNFFEKKLNVIATTRNWRTIHKLVEMTE